MKVGIIGSRSFSDYELLCQSILSFTDIKDIECIISGNAKGADSLGERFANEHSIPLKLFYPQWKTYGKRAGVIRNTEIVQHSDNILAFWDGKSKGTKDTIQKATKLNVPIEVIQVE